MNQQKRILLVDDDEEDRMLIHEAFTEIGAPDIVHFETNGEDAIAYLDSHTHALPYLIILDLNMPRMNGTQTLRYLKDDERYKAITVIIYSTSMNPLEREACLDLGAHSYVVKPTLYQESLDTVAGFYKLCEELAANHLLQAADKSQ
jgi:CheY-like chemotaxis protein